MFKDKPVGHPDQVPYILAWQDMMENPPPWLKPFLPPKAGPAKFLGLRKAKKETKSAPLSGLAGFLPEDLILPPPYQAPPPPFGPSTGGTGGCRRGAPPRRGSPCAGASRGDAQRDPPGSSTA